MKVSENQKQFYLFNIPITTIPKIDTTTNELLLLSVKKCFKILENVCGGIYFYQSNRRNFVLALVLVSVLVSVLVPQSSASKNLEKFPFNQCYRPAVYWL